MPPKTTDLPPHLRPFVSHGVEFPRSSTLSEKEEVCGTCVFCGKTKFYVEPVSERPIRYDCKTCGRTGNTYDFLREVWTLCYAATSERDYEVLAENRGVPAEHLRAYGLCKGFVGDWIAPGYGVKGDIVNLYRWVKMGEGRIVIPTSVPAPNKDAEPGATQHGYFAPVPLERPATWDAVEWCEGVFDSAARRWAISGDKDRLSKTLVVGVPGCNVWTPGWGKLSGGKATTLLYDNDHPKTNPTTGVVTQAARSGVVRVAGMLSEFSDPPASTACLVWGPDGYDPLLPSGYDLRDVGRDHNGTAAAFVDARVAPVPEAWLAAVEGGSGDGKPPSVSSKARVVPLVCRSWGELTAAWKEAIYYSDEFEAALTFALSVAVAVTHGKERLWGRVIGAPGTGKSLVCEGLSVSTKHNVTESTITSFYSGAKTEDGKDHSFANRLWNKLWINNDADTMRTLGPARDTLFAQMRDLYGGRGSKAYGNGIGSRSYLGLKFGVLFAGTSEICELDAASLGARFLDFCWKTPDEATKFKIAMRAMQRQAADNGDKTGTDPELSRALRLTAGYLEHLRATWDGRSTGIVPSPIQFTRIYSLAQYVGKMRARPPKSQEERFDVDEMPTRLCMQMTSLAVWAAVVRGSERVDAPAMNLVRRVACDTAMGRTADIVKVIADGGNRGLTISDVARITRRRIDSEADLLNFLCEPTVGVLLQDESGVPSLTRQVRYRLTEAFLSVYRSVWH